MAPGGTLLHATSQEEKAASIARMPGMRAVVIPNGVDVPAPFPSRTWQPDGILRLMFLGRIDPKKGLPALVEAVGLLERGSGASRYLRDRRCRICRHAEAAGRKSRARRRGALSWPRRRRGEAAGLRRGRCLHPALLLGELRHGRCGGAGPWRARHRQPGRALARGRAARLRAMGGQLAASLAAAISSMRGQDLAAMGAAGRRWMEAEFDWGRIAARTLETMRELAQSLCARSEQARACHRSKAAQ